MQQFHVAHSINLLPETRLKGTPFATSPKNDLLRSSWKAIAEAKKRNRLFQFRIPRKPLLLPLQLLSTNQYTSESPLDIETWLWPFIYFIYSGTFSSIALAIRWITKRNRKATIFIYNLLPIALRSPICVDKSQAIDRPTKRNNGITLRGRKWAFHISLRETWIFAACCRCRIRACWWSKDEANINKWE